MKIEAQRVNEKVDRQSPALPILTLDSIQIANGDIIQIPAQDAHSPPGA
jgi:hypothetical protein